MTSFVPSFTAGYPEHPYEPFAPIWYGMVNLLSLYTDYIRLCAEAV
jgi:hypothetical protein